jgi:5-methylcytosine-specific restriction endonuclease McrA
MKVLQTYTFEQIEFLYKIQGIKTLPFGDGVPIKSKRLDLFMKNRTCVHCGETGSIFRLEIDRGGGICFNLYYSGKDGMMMTFDHIIPLSRGGANTLSNGQCMCRKCNNKKGNKLDEEWEEMRA